MGKKIAISFFVVFAIFMTTVFASDYEVTKYNIYADALENGDLNITEEIEYYFDDSMNGLFRNILYSYLYSGQKDDIKPASKRYQASNVENLNVWYSDTSFEDMQKAEQKDESELSNGMNGYYSVSTTNGELKSVRIKVYTPVKDGKKKYVKYTYTVKDVLVNYNDYAELYWNFIGGDWECRLNNVNIVLNLPQETSVKAYPHSYAKIDSFSNDGKTINLKFDYVYESVAVDIRAVFPNTILRSLAISKQVRENYNFEELDKVEAKLADNMKKNERFSSVLTATFVGSFLLGLVVMIFFGKAKDGRIKNYKKAELYTEIPENYSLAQYNQMRLSYTTSLSGDMIIATLMDLSHRKIIKMNAKKVIKGNKDKYDYMVSLNKDADYSSLTEYEQIIINYIFFQKCDSTVDASEITDEEFELNKRFKELASKYSLAEKVRVKVAKIDKEYKYYNGPKLKTMAPALISIAIVILVTIINLLFIGPAEMIAENLYIFFIPGFYAPIVLIISASKGIYLEKEYVEEYNKLQGLYKYLNDYSLLKERYPIEIALWDRYMVFACLFGIAEKVAKEFKEELIARGYSEESIYTTYSYIYIGTYSHTFSTGASSAAYTGSASSSSGGYSGGGGGGRRWRWRRRLLKDN